MEEVKVSITTDKEKESTNTMSAMEDGEIMSTTGEKKIETLNHEEKTITQLPFKILEKISLMLDYQNILKLRLTCSVLKNVIDTGVGVMYEFSERSSVQDLKEQLKFVSGVCLRGIYSTSMIGEEDSDGVRRYFNQEYLFGDLFSYLNSMRCLAVRGKIHVQYLFDALSQCQILEYVDVTNVNYHESVLEGDLLSLLIKDEVKEKPKINWNDSTWLSKLSRNSEIIQKIKCTKLKALILGFNTNDATNTNLLNAVLLMMSIRSETLLKFKLNLVGIKELTEMEYFHFSMILADFLDAHKETLKEFLMIMDPRKAEVVSDAEFEEVSSNTMFTEQRQLNSNDIEGGGDGGGSVYEKSRMIVTLRQKLGVIAKESNLKYLHIVVFPDFHWDFWHVFIENLQKLITLFILGSTKYGILNNCGFIRNSSKTLKRLRIDLDVTKDFDFSGIEDCEKLEEVYLHHYSTHPLASPFHVFTGTLDEFPRVRNCQLIPGGLKTLCLGRVFVCSEDLNKMLANQKKLETLVLLNKKIHNEKNAFLFPTALPFYPECKSLKKIFRMRHLQSCVIQNFRTTSKKTLERILEMLEFQMNFQIEGFVEELKRTGSENPQLFPLLLQHVTLDIVSTEGQQPYTWLKKDGSTYDYQVNVNTAAKDPYIPKLHT